jgi:hypothetical protein
MVARVQGLVERLAATLPTGGVTLDIRWPLGRAIALALLVLAVSAAAAEVVARSPIVREAMPVRGLGTRHLQFEVKLAKLEDFARAQHGVPCLILGSSTATFAIDPTALGQEVGQRTGCALECFNFGVRGLSPAGEAPLARILLDDFRPSIVVYGLDIVGFDEDVGETAQQAIFSTPWGRYRTGHPDWQGWLAEHSLAYRYFLPYRGWADPTYLIALEATLRKAELTDARGYIASTETLPEIGGPPDPAVEPRLFRVLRDFTLAEEALQGLRAAADLGRETQLVIVEMPVHSTFLDFLPEGEVQYNETKRYIAETLLARGVALIEADEVRLTIPEDGWINRNHINRTGAIIFTRWLAGVLSKDLQVDRLTCPTG